MNKTISRLLIPVGLYASISGIPAFADDITTKLDVKPLESIVKDSKDNLDWRVGISGSYAKPRLKKANQGIHDTELFLKDMSPEVKNFQDWSDVYNGTVNISIAKKVEFGGVTFWPEFMVSYAKGSVKTNQSNLTNFDSSLMNYDFKQSSDLILLNFGLFGEVYNSEKLSCEVGGYIIAGRNTSDTKFNMETSSGDSEVMTAKFKEYAVGVAPAVRLNYKITNTFSAMLMGRYDFLNFKGDAEINDKISSAGDTQVFIYNQPDESDMTGFSAYAGIQMKF